MPFVSNAMDHDFASDVKKHFTLLETNRKGQHKWKCNHCKKIIKGTATRLSAHLIRINRQGIKSCKDVPDAVRTKVRIYATRKTGVGKYAGGKAAGTSRQVGGTTETGKGFEQRTLEDLYEPVEKDGVDALVAFMLYDNGVSFKVIE